MYNNIYFTNPRAIHTRRRNRLSIDVTPPRLPIYRRRPCSENRPSPLRARLPLRSEHHRRRRPLTSLGVLWPDLCRGFKSSPPPKRAGKRHEGFSSSQRQVHRASIRRQRTETFGGVCLFFNVFRRVCFFFAKRHFSDVRPQNVHRRRRSIRQLVVCRSVFGFFQLTSKLRLIVFLLSLWKITFVDHN